MKRSTLSLTLAALLLTLAVTAMAQPAAPRARRAAEIDHRAVTLTEAAHLHGLLKAFDPRVTAATVVAWLMVMAAIAPVGSPLDVMESSPLVAATR